MVGGRWAGLVNLYWSPLYPALIGAARLIFGAAPAREVPLEHLAAFAAFLAAFAAFEYFVIPVLVIASRVRGAALRGAAGRAVAYAAFGVLALTMTPLELTTPDLLAAAAVLVALGALLRLRPAAPSAAPSPEWRTAAILGLALGIGALAKSFLVPWALVCFATLAVATRRRGGASTAVAILAWALIAAPWCGLLSARAGRLTFGDTGRLNYVWYVNSDDPPSLGGVPPGARTASSDLVLPGVGVVGDAPGTDPMWLDPTRWNAVLRPHWSLADQWGTLEVAGTFYLQQLAPLFFLVTLVCVAPPGSRRRAWSLGWVAFVPAAIGLGAYALVIVTARYIMPFVLALVLLVLATVPVPRRLRPDLALVGLFVPMALLTLDEHTRYRLGFAGAPLAALIAALVVSLGYWLLARRAVRRSRTTSFARGSAVGLATVVALLFARRVRDRAGDDVTAFTRARSPIWGNVPARIADDLAAHGVASGTGIAVIGPHAEAYWARAGRLHIVADVPRRLAARYWNLPQADQDSLLNQFAAAGAAYAVASVPPSDGAPTDTRWRPVGFGGWIRPLKPDP